MSRPNHNDELPQVISVAPCEGWWVEYTVSDGNAPMRERVVAFGILRTRDDDGFFHEATALVDDGSGGLAPAADATNFARIVHRDDVEAEHALPALMNWFERMVADPSAYLTDADISLQRKHLRVIAEQRGVMPEPADTGNEGS